MSTGVYIVSAPSGSGKTTLVERLLREVPRLQFSVSYTTRKPRGTEQHGKEYFFVTREEFEAMIEQQDLLEWAEVFENYYGTSRSIWDKSRQAGNDLLLDIDVQGAQQVKEKIPDAVSIFILPPSRQVLEFRLRSRSQDSEAVIAKRLENARKEIHGFVRYDYVLINEDLEQSARSLRSIILAERWRRDGALSPGAGADTMDSVRQFAEGCRMASVRSHVQPILESFGG
jgi:guanylate kinase